MAIDYQKTYVPSVVIADTDPKNAEATAKFLLDSGYVPFIARNLDQVMDQIGRSQSSICLLDITLPGFNDSSKIAEIRRLSPESVVLVYCDNASINEASLYIEAGAYDYLQKPMDPDEIITAINRVMHRRSIEANLRHLRQRNIILAYLLPLCALVGYFLFR